MKKYIRTTKKLSEGVTVVTHSPEEKDKKPYKGFLPTSTTYDFRRDMEDRNDRPDRY